MPLPYFHKTMDINNQMFGDSYAPQSPESFFPSSTMNNLCDDGLDEIMDTMFDENVFVPYSPTNEPIPSMFAEPLAEAEPEAEPELANIEIIGEPVDVFAIKQKYNRDMLLGRDPRDVFESLANTTFLKIPDFNAYVEMLCDVGDKVENFGSMFSRPDLLNAATLFFAFAKNIVSPAEYMKSVKKFGPTVGMVVDSKWGDIIAKVGRNTGKRKAIVMLADLIESGGKADDMKQLGRFMKKLGMKAKNISAEKLCRKYGLTEAQIDVAIVKMGL